MSSATVAAASGTTEDEALLHQAAACLLGYPDDAFAAQLPLVRAALADVKGPGADRLRSFADHAAGTPTAELAEHYVQVFDFARAGLYLSWWTDGDTRRRGQSLVRFKEHYRAHGFEFAAGAEELPDYLPVVLEFSAAARTAGLLAAHRPALELLRLALVDADTPYRLVLDGVCATLPGPSPKDRAEARALIRSGPPSEDVGLEPYGHLGLLPLLTTGEH
ncbi:nitrate reductase molybdenum cofactor assembly chaperone [Yinghuangia soli]|uniref:Nitrate reductase molybdenum cofactor assembly chaperone n=1 Tax=Yinghuangia soli TaxID=2908204 RepID=A0AA41U9D9_9ACTN|nr:nitrate reductase molybdenum cofactor assembly chaperone [Yinghuangia soli]MCF2533774.1 nitrate reductase molybdenum cofactor assembly chaperone [Yinghuangia soli]